MSDKELGKGIVSLVKRVMVWSAAIYYALIACMFFIVGMVVEPIITGFMAGGNYMEYTVDQIRKVKKK